MLHHPTILHHVHCSEECYIILLSSIMYIALRSVTSSSILHRILLLETSSLPIMKRAKWPTLVSCESSLRTNPFTTCRPTCPVPFAGCHQRVLQSVTSPLRLTCGASVSSSGRCSIQPRILTPASQILRWQQR